MWGQLFKGSFSHRASNYDFTGYTGFAFLGNAGQKLPAGDYFVYFANQ